MLGLLLLQVLASCLWLGHSKVVTTFDECSQFFYKKYYPNDVLRPKNSAKICQFYSNDFRYATLYNTELRIPVYSAYIYQPGHGTRSPMWFVEPQLINEKYPKDMNTEDYIIQKYEITPKDIGKTQAINPDYNHLHGLSRGHLSPSGHQTGNASKWATFTLTNIVPQDKKLNEGAWRNYENQTMPHESQGCNTTYVITGAVPGNNYISKKRVNIPSYIWSAACCLVGTEPTRAWAAIARNNRDLVEDLSLGELEKRLHTLYGGKKVTLFDNQCRRDKTPHP